MSNPNEYKSLEVKVLEELQNFAIGDTEINDFINSCFPELPSPCLFVQIGEDRRRPIDIVNKVALTLFELSTDRNELSGFEEYTFEGAFGHKDNRALDSQFVDVENQNLNEVGRIYDGVRRNSNASYFIGEKLCAYLQRGNSQGICRLFISQLANLSFPIFGHSIKIIITPKPNKTTSLF